MNALKSISTFYFGRSKKHSCSSLLFLLDALVKLWRYSVFTAETLWLL